jgi:hypothetical protein
MKILYKGIIWIGALYLSYYLGLVEIFFITCGIWFIFMNLGERKGASAYSVFNDGCKSLAGDFKPDSMILNKKTDENQKNLISPQYFMKKQKFANKPCPCGSGKKHKKCCLHKNSSDSDNS